MIIRPGMGAAPAACPVWSDTEIAQLDDQYGPGNSYSADARAANAACVAAQRKSSSALVWLSLLGGVGVLAFAFSSK